ncbi:MAG: pyruvate ferredoxin oxidoreductase, partial [bacterium]
LLDLDKPVTYGPLVLQDYYMEFKRTQHEAFLKVPKVALDVAKEFERISGRKYGLFENYFLDDADLVLVVLNSAAGTAKDVVDDFRAKGIRAGLLKPRLFRPFPYAEVAQALKSAKAIAVLDRADSFGGFGPMYMEIASALMLNGTKPFMVNKIYGLGGRDFFPEQAEMVLNELKGITETGKVRIHKEYIGVKE